MIMVAQDTEKVSGISLVATTKIVLILEYDGTGYYGFQWQADLPTIQGKLEAALEKLTGEKRRVLAASRTDTGVHACGQVVSFRTTSTHSPHTFVNGLNYYLPRNIVVKAAYNVRGSFNVRSQATSREYNYYILNSATRSPLKASYVSQVGGKLDIQTMNHTCRALLGEHDLASFASDLSIKTKSTIRRVYRAEFSQEGELVIFNIVAGSFLPHQVRNTVGTLIRVGQGKMSVGEFCSILDAKKPGLAGPTAPANGLCLMRVNYPHSLEEEKL